MVAENLGKQDHPYGALVGISTAMAKQDNPSAAHHLVQLHKSIKKNKRD
jgi:hypothetical protein